MLICSSGFLIYLLSTSLSYLLFGYRQVLITAHQRNDVVSKIQSTILIMLNSLQIIALLVFPNFYLFMVLVPLTTIVQNVALYIMSNRLFPQYKELGYLKTGLSKEEKEIHQAACDRCVSL